MMINGGNMSYVILMMMMMVVVMMVMMMMAVVMMAMVTIRGSRLPCYVFFLCMLTNPNENKLSWVINYVCIR